MTAGYFNRLAAQTLGTALRLRPIVPSRFEPVRWQEPVVEEIEEQLLYPIASAPSAPHALDQPTVSRAARPEARPLDAAPADERSLRPGSPLGGEVRSWKVPRPRPEPSGFEATKSADPVPAHVKRPTKPVTVPASDRGPTEPPAPDDGDVDRTAGPLGDWKPLVSRAIKAPPVRRRLEDPVDSRQQSNSLPPTVIVRIGRVDVQAVTKAAQQPAQPAARVTVRASLADYLRARNEGRR